MKRLILFDVDGTVTTPRGAVGPRMMDKLRQLREASHIGVIGGSTLEKLRKQLGADVLDEFDYVFAECGLVAFKSGQKLPSQRFIEFIGEEKYKSLVNFILRYIADLDLPIKRGTFIEFRDGLINVCPQGRNTTPEEQVMFEAYDAVHSIRAKMVDALKAAFPSHNLVCAIGGRTSFDLFPRGWDKTYALRHIDEAEYNEIHYFWDKTQEGGNDYEIFHDSRVIGHTVSGPADTMSQVDELLSTTHRH